MIISHRVLKHSVCMLRVLKEDRTVPVHVFTQRTIAAWSCQPGGSLMFTLTSLQCVFTYQSLHCKGPVNADRAWAGGQYVSALLQEQGCSFASFINFPLTAVGAKLGPCLVEMLSPLKPERSRKSMCCHVLPLHPRNIGELSPFFPPSKREVLQTARRHRIDGGARG